MPGLQAEINVVIIASGVIELTNNLASLKICYFPIQNMSHILLGISSVVTTRSIRSFLIFLFSLQRVRYLD